MRMEANLVLWAVALGVERDALTLRAAGGKILRKLLGWITVESISGEMAEWFKAHAWKA